MEAPVEYSKQLYDKYIYVPTRSKSEISSISYYQKSDMGKPIRTIELFYPRYSE